MSADRIVLYGSLMRGLGAMDQIGVANGLAFEGPAVIPGELFDLGDYPGFRRGEGRVAAELYTIFAPEETLSQLDVFEGVVPGRPVESLYLRERIQLLEPAGCEAWVYLYNRSPSPASRIAGGDWRIHRRQRGDR